MEKSKKLEYRMYFFVLSSLADINKGIQCGHVALEYAKKYGNTKEYKEFINECKTWIILDGGTTNDKRDLNGFSTGSLNQIADMLSEKNIPFSYFLNQI